MSEVYGSLCKELDNLLIDIIEDMEGYMQSKVELENIMHHGFVNIAKTRYINGQSSVTTLQLPTEFSKTLQPLATVIRTPKENSVGDKVEISNKLTSLPNEVTGEIREDVENDTGEKLTDPIRLFGVLVPQSLKQSQKSFVNALDQVATTTEYADSLDYKLKRYSKLMTIKRKLTTTE